ncbi:hypothetical protein [Smaragdicoccus niigatensis]|uniref:hypothetical protein n=1 Tax=Smaragdicoccus niigatensis TaxID=359359 RepID=UPI0003723AEF|nr:hypothetical protein [Smaragdicoccus niigatensis]
MPVTTLLRDSRFATWLITGITLVGLYYLAYRYPFRINSKRTSSTYSDTPVVLQYGKYVVLLAVCGLACLALLDIWRHQRRLPRDWSGGVVWFPVLSAWAVFAWLVSRDDVLTFAFAVFVAATIVTLREFYRSDVSALLPIFGVFAIVAVIVDAIQVLLFFTTGRLPALGYAHSLSVRFGSLLDDPNGYAILCALLIVVAWVWPRRPWARIGLTVSVFVSLLLTQSFTGAVATCVAVSIVAVAAYWSSHRRTVLAVGGGLIACGLAAAALIVPTHQFQRLLQQKQGSIEYHGESLDVLFGLGWRALLHGTNTGIEPPESGYVSLIAHLGAVGFVLFLIVGIGSVVRLRRHVLASDGTVRSVYVAAMTFQIAFLLAMINLPPHRVFPLDIFFFTFAALSSVPVFRASVDAAGAVAQNDAEEPAR